MAKENVSAAEVKRGQKSLAATLEKAFGKPGAAGDQQRYDARQKGGKH